MNCRNCGALVRLPLIDLGTAPPSNAYLSEQDLPEPEKWFPLRVVVCETCWLVQTEVALPPGDVFGPEYAYFSSYSTTWLKHVSAFVESAVKRFALDSNSLVIEVASNDGYLLQRLDERGIPTLGVEPTASTARAAREKGLRVIEAFFGLSLASQIARDGRADLVVANNVLAHVPDINDFVAGIATILKSDGVVTFEFAHLQRLIAGCQFDTIYHEHYSYLSLTTVSTILEAHDLVVFDVEELPTHGGSLRVYARPRRASRPVSDSVGRVRAEEDRTGLTSATGYAGFQQEAERVKDGLLDFLLDAKSAGAVVAGYGAAAKGNTLLNFAGVRSDLVRFVVDANPAKQGKYLPGSRIPIKDLGALQVEEPSYLLILPWNLADEVVDSLASVRDAGTRFLVAVPRLEYLS